MLLAAESSVEVVAVEAMLLVSLSERLGDVVGTRGATKNRPDWEDSEDGLVKVSLTVFLLWEEEESAV